MSWLDKPGFEELDKGEFEELDKGEFEELWALAGAMEALMGDFCS